MTFFTPDETLEKFGKHILESSLTFGIAANEIAFTWIVYDNPVIVNTGGAISATEFWKYVVRGFSYRGGERIYPASIVKLFYLVAIEEWLASKMVTTTAELERAIHDMIVTSSDDAASLVVDVLTGTTSGPELASGPFETWKFQRNIVNRYFQSLGWRELETVNLNQKTWADGAYGRERIFLGELRENRNMLTTDAVARLLHSIIGGVAVSSERSLKMMDLLKRSLAPEDLADNNNNGEDQVTGFLGEGLPPDSRLWSKAGWTSQVRHDAAYIEIPDLQPYLLVVFTNTNNRQILPFISRAVVEAMGNIG